MISTPNSFSSIKKRRRMHFRIAPSSKFAYVIRMRHLIGLRKVEHVSQWLEAKVTPYLQCKRDSNKIADRQVLPINNCSLPTPQLHFAISRSICIIFLCSKVNSFAPHFRGCVQISRSPSCTQKITLYSAKSMNEADDCYCVQVHVSEH
jgi:hypothetical protein